MKHIAFTFDPLTENDLPLLTNWLNRSHLQKWWRNDKATPDQVRKKYLPRITEPDTAKPFIAYVDETAIGYIQYYRASAGDPNWWPDEPGEGVLGIDQFLADANHLGRGVGTEMVSQFVQLLMEDQKVTEIRVDPRPENLRAIRCYEKAGFQKVTHITTPDGPALMMVIKRDS